MTKFRQELRQCPLCLNEEKATVWELIDPQEDPDLREKLLCKKLQLFTCSICGQVYHMDEPLTYIDQDIGLIAYYSPVLAEIFAGDAGKKWQILPQDLLSDLPTIAESDQDKSQSRHWRLCTDMNALIEKIHIFEAGLDDRLIEVVKLAIITGLLTEEQKIVEKLHFLAASDEEMLFIAQYAEAKSAEQLLTDADPETLQDEREVEQLALSLELYRNTEQLVGGNLPEDKLWSLVDENFAKMLINLDGRNNLG